MPFYGMGELVSGHSENGISALPLIPLCDLRALSLRDFVA